MYLVTEDWYFLSHRLPMALAAQRAEALGGPHLESCLHLHGVHRPFGGRKTYVKARSPGEATNTARWKATRA